MQLIDDLVDPAILTQAIRLIEDTLPDTLRRFFPNQMTEDLEYQFRRGQFKLPEMAAYRAFDAESPIAKRQGVAKVSGEIPPISLKIPLGEEERLRKRRIETGDTAAIEAAIYSDAESLTKAIISRVIHARGQALVQGKVVLDENGVSATADYGLPAANQKVAAVVWSNATADIVEELTTWMEEYVDTNGFPPGLILTSTKVRGNMLRNDGFRTLLASVVGSPSVVTVADMQRVLEAHGLPPIEVYDGRVTVGGVYTRVTNEEFIIFIPPPDVPLGTTLWGVTAEALELQESRRLDAAEAPGLVAVVAKTFDPVATWTKVAALTLPVIYDATTLFVADVL